MTELGGQFSSSSEIRSSSSAKSWPTCFKGLLLSCCIVATSDILSPASSSPALIITPDSHDSQIHVIRTSQSHPSHNLYHPVTRSRALSDTCLNYLESPTPPLYPEIAIAILDKALNINPPSQTAKIAVPSIQFTGSPYANYTNPPKPTLQKREETTEKNITATVLQEKMENNRAEATSSQTETGK